MPKYIIERDVPGAGKLSPQELKSVSQSCDLLRRLRARDTVIDPTTAE